jgi:hypothetical protein
MTTEHELTTVDPQELLVVEGGTYSSPIPTDKSRKAINDFLAILDHAIAAAKKA